jgi:O-antigen ligase
MRWLLIGYMFLFIDRPFEVWPWLGDLHVERVYMLVTLAFWVVYPNKRFLPNAQHAAYAAFATAVVGCWVMSPWAEQGQPVVEDWFKIVVFYVLLVTTVHDEEGLKHIAVGFLAVMGLYLLHSFREYLGGRHTYRMGISRMIGVDTSLGDPNSFGASIVYALPLVTALWRAGVGGAKGRLLLAGYVGLSSLCILLTGSRGSLIALLVWGLIVIWGTRYRFRALAALAVAAPLAFAALPESLQTRFETIVNPEVGPKNAAESGEGRIEGLLTGLRLWQANPLTGVGPGAWRPATRSKIESHNLYGQLLGETGTVGAVAFLALLGCFWANLRAVRRVRRDTPEWRNDLVCQLPAAVGTGVFLLLFVGNFGHNLFRFTWLWYGGFLIIARHCVARRVAEWEPEAEAEYADEPAADPVPAGWVLHPPHLHA